MGKRIQKIKHGASCYHAKILDKDEREVYLETAKKTAEKFGDHSVAYRIITHGINTRCVFWRS